ncbi:MAG: phage tail assembly chaperone [Pseudomonadota bacterium]
MSLREAAPKWCWLAARVLGWRPGDFWQATPAELRNALSNPDDAQTGAPPSREQIQMMMERDCDGR